MLRNEFSMNRRLIAIDEVNTRQSIIGISLLTKLLKNRGYNAQKLLDQAGISSELLLDPKATISFQQDVAFTRELINTLQDDDLGFKAGQCFRLNAFGHIGLAASSSDTVSDAITFFLKYIHLAYTPFLIDFFIKEGNAVLRFNDQFNLGDLRRFYLERDFSFAFLSTRDMFPRSIEGQKPKTIHFDFPCPTNIEHYQALYECPVHFSMPYNEILFDERYLDLALPLANSLIPTVFVIFPMEFNSIPPRIDEFLLMTNPILNPSLLLKAGTLSHESYITFFPDAKFVPDDIPTVYLIFCWA